MSVLFLPPILGTQDTITLQTNADSPEVIYHTIAFNKKNSNLPGDKIKCLSKTEDAAIWIGTDKGIVRYDKGRWHGFTSEDSKLPGNVISVFLADRDSLWVATDEVVARYNMGKWQDFTKKRDNLPGGKIYVLIKGKSGKIWLGTSEGLAYFDNKQWHKLNDMDGKLSGTSINALAETEDDALWVGTDSGLECFYKEKWQDLTDEDRNFPKTPITALLKTRRSLWVGTNSGLGRLATYKGAWQRSTYEEIGLLNITINTLYETDDGSIWIGTGEGLWHLEEGSLKRFENSKGDRLEGRLTCLLESFDGALWVGTNNGLFRIQERRWRIFRYWNRQLTAPQVKSLIKTNDGAIWAGTNQGLAYFDDGEWKFFTDENSIIDIRGRRVLALAKAEDNSLWVGFDDGIVRIQNNRIQESWTSDDGFELVNALTITKNNSVWAGTQRGLYRYRRGSWRLERHDISDVNSFLEEKKYRSNWVGFNGGLAIYHQEKWEFVDRFEKVNINIKALEQTDDGTLWVGCVDESSQGSLGWLHYFKDNRWEHFHELTGKDMGDIEALQKSHDGALWVGTQKGLARIYEGELQIFTTSNSGLNDNFIMSLTEDDEGFLWIGTRSGVARFCPPTPEERPYVELIKPSNKNVLTQREQIFDAFAFDPKYQTEPHMFEYHWKIISDSTEVIHEQVSKESLLIYSYEDGRSYTVMVTCTDRYGYRSVPDEHPFRISLPKPPEPSLPKNKDRKITKYIEKYLKEILLLIVFLLILLYPKLAKFIVNSGIFNKFPQVLNIIVSSDRVRRHLFFPPEDPLDLHQVPQQISRADASKAETIPVLNDDVNQVLEKLFVNRKHAMIIGPSNSGKSKLLSYLYNRMASRFKKRIRKKTYLPVLVDIATASISGRTIEDMILNTFYGQGIELPQEVIRHMLLKGGFIIFIDSLDRKEEKRVKDIVNEFLNRNQHLKNKILMACQYELTEDRSDIDYYKPC